MKQYAEDAMTTNEPWNLWEIYNKTYNKWHKLQANPAWFEHIKYRRKHGIEAMDRIRVAAREGLAKVEAMRVIGEYIE